MIWTEMKWSQVLVLKHTKNSLWYVTVSVGFVVIPEAWEYKLFSIRLNVSTQVWLVMR